MAKDKKDLLIPLLPSCLTDELFNKYRDEIIKKNDIIKKFGEKEVVELSLNGNFGISLNTTIIKTNKKLILHQNFKKLIHHQNFKPVLKNEYLFTWDDIPGNNNGKIKECLNKRFGIDWANNAEIEKIQNGKTVKVYTEINSLSLILNDEKTRVSLKIDDGITDEFVAKLENSKLNIYKNDIDELDRGFFGESKSPFKRSIYCMEKPLKINFLVDKSTIKQVDFYLFINSSCLEKLDDVYINTFTLTTFNPKTKTLNNVSLSNIEVINLSKQCAKTFNEIFNEDKHFGKYFEELCNIKDSDYKSIDDIFRSIQFWSNPTDNAEVKDDAREIIKSGIYKGNLNNMYYFYSIVTNDYKSGLFRRHYEYIVDVVGHCQSVSKAYFDIFYGNVCLEVTIKPKDKTFKQIGHDSEEFRIWEILALQKYLLKKTDVSKLGFYKLNDDFFDFSAFTKKLEKGGSWIDYAKYLQQITGIEYYYKKRKNEFELKERENAKSLQKLNFLIIISIFISIISFFLTPIYSSIKEYPVKTTFEEYISKNSYPEITTIILSAILTFQFWLILSPYPGKILGLLKTPKKESKKKVHWVYWVIIELEVLSVIFIIFFIYITKL